MVGRILAGILGILMLGTGVLWTLQGVGVVQGSVMTGRVAWAIIGPILALAGLALVAVSARGRRL